MAKSTSRNLDPEVFERAAERVLEGDKAGCCYSLLDAYDDLHEGMPDRADEYRALLDEYFGAGQHRRSFWWPITHKEPRILALLLLADIVIDENRK